MKHGNYYYKQKNSEIRKAVKYLFNERIGYWCQIQNDFQFCGKYMCGKKVGIWKFYHNNNLIYRQLIFSANNCDYNSDGQKQGDWEEIVMNIKQEQKFASGRFVTEITSKVILTEGGKYNAWGWKTGFWKDINDKVFQSFYHLNSDLKIRLIYLNVNFIYYKLKYKIYYRENIALGFSLMYDFQNIVRGGGRYDQNEQKIGIWKDISDQYFCLTSQTIREGEYFEGFRVGPPFAMCLSFFLISYERMVENDDKGSQTNCKSSMLNFE